MAVQEETIVWDERVKGFTTFQSYFPDSGLSLNNRHFTFKNGGIWEHNVAGVPRNTFYNAHSDSIIDLVFNDEPSVVKNFKTLGYEGTGNWDVILSTDQESTVTDSTTIPVTRTVSGTIDVTDWVDREGKRFAWIRGDTQRDDQIDLTSKDLNGLGKASAVTSTTVTLNNVPNDYLSIGDKLYFFVNSGSIDLGDTFAEDLSFAGTIIAINGLEITYETSSLSKRGKAAPLSDFFFAYKNEISEKSGIIGFFNVVRFSNNNTDKSELFSVESEVFLSTT